MLYINNDDLPVIDINSLINILNNSLINDRLNLEKNTYINEDILSIISEKNTTDEMKKFVNYLLCLDDEEILKYFRKYV
jgi:accessory colonization factor AcfC